MSRTMAAAAAMMAASLSIAGADPANWRTLVSKDGVKFHVNMDSIRRKTMDHANLPAEAQVLVYRDAGGPPDDQEFYTMVFDCRGSFMPWNHPEETTRIKYGSVASRIEDVACWGATAPAR